MQLEPAGHARAWMDETFKRNANRCLPLLIANQAGWWLRNSQEFSVIWRGGQSPADLKITYEDASLPAPAESIFGHGIVSFRIPYFFRTSPGWNLLVRGPANFPKDGVSPLEGLIETDWTPASFLMSWQVTRSDARISFAADDPICMVVPQRRHQLESFRPTQSSLDHMPDDIEYQEWRRSRDEFRKRAQIPGTPEYGARWTRDYMIGRHPDGSLFGEHQRRLRLRNFETENRD